MPSIPAIHRWSFELMWMATIRSLADFGNQKEVMRRLSVIPCPDVFGAPIFRAISRRSIFIDALGSAGVLSLACALGAAVGRRTK